MAEYSKPVRVFFRLSTSPPFFQNFTPVRAAIFVPDDIKHTSHYLGVLLKFAEERREINNMFSAASLPAHLDTKLLISLLLRRTQRVPALGDRSLAEKGSIKISFGVISEVRPREDEEKGKTLEEKKKSKSCKRNAFVLACKRRLMQVRNLKAHQTISGLSARKSVFC